MTGQPEIDAEALAAYEEYYRALAVIGVRTAHNAMRCALDKAAAFRRAQPASELADDARKVVQALALIECVYRKNCVGEGEPSSVLDAVQAALLLAGSLAGKIEELIADRDHAFRTRDLFGIRANNELARAEAAEATLAALECRSSNIVEKLRMAAQCESDFGHSKLLEEAATIISKRDAEAAAYARGVKDAANVAESLYVKGSAHTYSSENADRYIVQEETCELVAKLIRALLPKEPTTEKDSTNGL